MKKVKVKYIGPGHENDQRKIEVSPDEAEMLEDGGLWEKVKPRTVKAKKETNDG